MSCFAADLILMAYPHSPNGLDRSLVLPGRPWHARGVSRRPRPNPLVAAALACAALGLAVVALVLAVSNPSVDVPQRSTDWYGATYECLAPYDTVLNGADNFPGGEPPPDADQIAADCRVAGWHRFELGGVTLLGALLLLGMGWVAWRPE